MGSYSSQEYQQFRDTRLASYYFLDTASETPMQFTLQRQGTTYHFKPNFLYCCMGINNFRHYQSMEQYGVNAMAMIGLYLEYEKFMSDTGGLIARKPFERWELDNYFLACGVLQRLVQEYVTAKEDTDPKALKRLLAQITEQEKAVHSVAIPLANRIKETVGQWGEPRYPDAGIAVQQQRIAFNRYYATQCMILLQELVPYVNTFAGVAWRNAFRKNSFSASRNGLAQALIPVLTNAIGVFSSYGCKSANDRTTQVALLVGAFRKRVAAKLPITPESVRELNAAVAAHYAHSATQVHSQLDLRGGGQKCETPQVKKSTSYRERRLLSKESPHMRLQKGVKLLPGFMSLLGVLETAASRSPGGNEFYKNFPQGILQEYENRCKGSWKRHTRSAAVKALCQALSTMENITLQTRILYFQYTALKSGVLKGILQEQLCWLVNKHFQGIAGRGANIHHAIRSALIENDVITVNGSTPAIEAMADSAAKLCVTTSNCALEKAIEQLFWLAEKNLTNTNPDLYTAIERLSQLISVTPREDLAEAVQQTINDVLDHFPIGESSLQTQVRAILENLQGEVLTDRVWPSFDES